MPVSQNWLSELDQKIQDRQVQQDRSFQGLRNKSPECRKKYFFFAAAIIVLTVIVVSVCLVTIDYGWNDDDEVKHEHKDYKDSVNLSLTSVKVDMSPVRASALEPVEMAAPEVVHRDMRFDHPRAQYFAGPIKVMSNEERIKYERMMHPVPTNFQEFMDNQKFVYHVMDFSNLMPPPASRSQQPASGNTNHEDEEDDDENQKSEGLFQPFHRSVLRIQDPNAATLIPSDFLTQQFLDSVNKRKKEQLSRSEGYSDSPDEPLPRRGHAGQLRSGTRSGNSNAVPNERAFMANELRRKQSAAPLPAKERKLDDLFSQADRNIEEIAKMKQTANFLMTAIGRMLVQKAQIQQQKDLKRKPASVSQEESVTKRGPEEKGVIPVDSERKLDHLLDVADQDIAKLSQKTNQTDRLMDLISQVLSASLTKEMKEKTLEEKEAPTHQQFNGDNFPFLPFFSPISIQRKEHAGQPFGTEKPGYLFLGEPMVGAEEPAVESLTDLLMDSKVLPPYSMHQPPAFNGKPLDDHPDDTDSGDVIDDDDSDEDDDDESAKTASPVTSQPTAHVSPKAMVREKRISRPAMFRMGRND